VRAAFGGGFRGGARIRRGDLLGRQTGRGEEAGGATFLRLRDLKKLPEERRNNGLRKTDENDWRL
jgi:hypothetical protein